MLHTQASALFRFAPLAPFALGLTACSAGTGYGTGGLEDTGTATAEVTLAPTSVQCAVLEVVGTKTVTQAFELAPETSTVFDLQKLPFGQDQFSAKAYATPCGSVMRNTPPSFVSDTVVADVERGLSPSVTLQMAPPNGSATVGLNFPTPTTGTITEFLQGQVPPNAIATGSDGNLWFTAFSAPVVFRIKPDGTQTELPSQPCAPQLPHDPCVPQEITAGPDGNLWFTGSCKASGCVGRLTTTGAVTVFPTGGADPTAITAGPDGALWFTELVGNKIGRIEINGTITEFTVPTMGASPNSIATGSDGNLWFTESSAFAVGHITPGGAVTELPTNPCAPQFPHNPCVPQDIAPGPDGNLWFTCTEGHSMTSGMTSDCVGRITTAGTITGFPTSSLTGAVCAGPDGNVWFGESNEGIARITPAGAITEFLLPTAGTFPKSCTSGPDGKVWFTEIGAANKIANVTP
jgi:streptogramin lyase